MVVRGGGPGTSTKLKLIPNAVCCKTRYPSCCRTYSCGIFKMKQILNEIIFYIYSRMHSPESWGKIYWLKMLPKTPCNFHAFQASQALSLGFAHTLFGPLLWHPLGVWSGHFWSRHMNATSDHWKRFPSSLEIRSLFCQFDYWKTGLQLAHPWTRWTNA